MPVQADGSDLTSEQRLKLKNLQGALLTKYTGPELPADVLLKQCTSCNVIKPISKYYLNRQGAYGVHPRCISCLRRQRKHTPPRKTGVKQCVQCDQTKPVREFYVNSIISDGRSSYCKECQILITLSSRGRTSDVAGGNTDHKSAVTSV